MIPDGLLIALARYIAAEAHAGSTRWDGQPYITHPAAVAGALDDPSAIAVAWLHDVVEDTWLTLGDLESFGIPRDVVEAVDAMTRRDGERYTDYIARVRENPIARRVKIADIRHNLIDLPKDHGLNRRYLSALRSLEATTDVSTPAPVATSRNKTGGSTS